MSHAHPFRAALAGAAALPQLRWPQAGLLALLCSGVAMAALPSAPESPLSEQHQWDALAVAPLSAGGRTGLRMSATDAVQPLDVAPDRANVRLNMTLGEGDRLHALLMRAGASNSDAATAAALIDREARVRAGTSVLVILGEVVSGRRALQHIELSAGLGLKLQVLRDSTGALRLVRHESAIDRTPLRIRGRVGDGLYWSLRAAGATPHSAAEYLQALGTEIDVGSEINADDRFDLVVASRAVAGAERQIGPLLYAGIDRTAARDLQLVKWGSNGKSSWIDAAQAERPQMQTAGMGWPVSGRITSGFGYRVHPILRFARLHRGVDFGAAWGSPIVAAADGQVVRAGWAGGYGRQVRIAHGGGIVTSYSHMSSITAEAGSIVRRGQLIGYVGSSGLSTGPHLHYEVIRHGQAVNPLNVRFASTVVADASQIAAVKARLKALLSVGVKRG